MRTQRYKPAASIDSRKYRDLENSIRGRTIFRQRFQEQQPPYGQGECDPSDLQTFTTTDLNNPSQQQQHQMSQSPFAGQNTNYETALTELSNDVTRPNQYQ